MRRLSVSSSTVLPLFFLLVDGVVQFTEAWGAFQVLYFVGAKDSDQSGCVHSGHGARRGRQGLQHMSVSGRGVLARGGAVGEAGGEGGMAAILCRPAGFINTKAQLNGRFSFSLSS